MLGNLLALNMLLDVEILPFNYYSINTIKQLKAPNIIHVTHAAHSFCKGWKCWSNLKAFCTMGTLGWFARCAALLGLTMSITAASPVTTSQLNQCPCSLKVYKLVLNMKPKMLVIIVNTEGELYKFRSLSTHAMWMDVKLWWMTNI